MKAIQYRSFGGRPELVDIDKPVPGPGQMLLRITGSGVCQRWCGLGHPGAMAEYMIVKSPRYLVPIGDLDPVGAASLTDAALTRTTRSAPYCTDSSPGRRP